MKRKIIIIIIFLLIAFGMEFKVNAQEEESPVLSSSTLASDNSIAGWKKTIFISAEGNKGVSFSFYYPSEFETQHTDQLSPASSMDYICKPVFTGSAISYDQVAQLSLKSGSTFEVALQDRIDFIRGNPIIEDFSTTSGLTGKKIIYKEDIFGMIYQKNVILLRSGKESELGKEIVIIIDGTYGYGEGSGHGMYAGTSDIIDKIAKTVTVQ